MGFSPGVWPRIRRRGLPIVHTLHDYYLLCPNATMFRDGRNCAGQHWDCRAYSLPRLRASRSVDAVVGVSRSVLERHLRHGAFRGVPRRHVIHNMYRPGAGTEARSGAVGDRPLRFGFIGQLSPIKGIELLLQAAAGMPRDGWELLVAGKGVPAYTDALRDRYSSTPAVRFLGFTRPEDFFAQVDVLVLPSIWHEPLGTVVIEALAHGVPVIGSARGGTPEMVEHERNGLLFDPDRPEALRASMETFLRRPELVEEMRPHCLRKARTFEPERILPRYEAVYADVLAGRGGEP
jgi:glycosyltransferase involved in cell wall biosynthesis